MQYEVSYYQYGVSDNLAFTRGNARTRLAIVEAETAAKAISKLIAEKSESHLVTTVTGVRELAVPDVSC